MYDCLRGVVRGERPAASITHEWQVVDDIRDHMLYFLENHDEQRIASDFFCGSAMKAIPAAAMSLFFQKNPFMLYSGQEFGEREWIRKDSAARMAVPRYSTIGVLKLWRMPIRIHLTRH